MTKQTRLDDQKVVVVATHGFEQSELTRPVEELRQAGATVHVVAPEGGTIRGWKEDDWGDEVEVDLTLAEADPAEYNALVLPGGVMNPDKLRMNEDVLRFVRDFRKGSKPVAAICHGPWTLIDAGGIAGHKVTSWPSLRCDLENAGCSWVDREVVVDRGLITSRKPDDLPAFCAAIVEALAAQSSARVG
jgi:protease I